MNDIGETIISSTEKIKKFNNEFKSFTTDKYLIVGAAAVCIGFATKDAIEGIMNQAILPVLKVLANASPLYLLFTYIKSKTIKMPILHVVLDKLGLVIWILIVWFLIIFVSYILFNKVLSVDIVGQPIRFIQTNTNEYILKQPSEQQKI